MSSHNSSDDGGGASRHSPIPLRSLQPTHTTGDAAAAEAAARKDRYERHMAEKRRAFSPPPVTLWSGVYNFFARVLERLASVLRRRFLH